MLTLTALQTDHLVYQYLKARVTEPDLTPEAYHNQLVDAGWFPSIEDSRMIIELCYHAPGLDPVILGLAEKLHLEAMSAEENVFEDDLDFELVQGLGTPTTDIHNRYSHINY